MADNYPTDEEIEQAVKRAVDKHGIDIPDEYSMDDVVDAVKDDFFVNRHTAADVLDGIWHDEQHRAKITEKGVAWTSRVIARIGTGHDIPTYRIAREIVDIEQPNREIGVVLGDWTHLWDEMWAREPWDEVNYRIDKRQSRGLTVHKPDWVDRALEIRDETNLSWQKSKVIALLENDDYPEQQQIADLMAVSPSAISEHKRNIEDKIDDVEWLKATSDYF